MAKIETYACDICGAKKGEGNGWWIGQSRYSDRFTISKWEKLRAEEAEDTWHLCGSQCLLEWVSQTVDKLSGVKEG